MFRSSTEDLVTCWQRCCRERAASCRVYRRCQSLRVRGKTVQCPPGLTCRRFLEQQQQQLEVVRDEISQPVIQQLITLLSDLEPSEKWPWPRPVILVFSKLPSGKQICAIVVKLSCGQSYTDTRTHLYIPRHQLLVPRYQLSSLGRRSFAVAGPTTWNSLSADLRDPPCSDESFRCSFKTFLFLFAKYLCVQRIRGFSTTMRYINRHYLSIDLSIPNYICMCSS